ncbi:cora-domain-containing protein [Pseudovirgaria hyperparasitica]|uniref:Cora-domain-containing protein n=1 Tax=Pseudovirgaria hyperparasitica TaxID=470096 RepID=A0A6A6VWH8_9PEZI|nr:cora-domain-containing protein [Pseudovirgaria hyperparasitica]KAF2753591.1 cora-domain-containing protein [Pseudovirgaria hyperparasitica]
MPPKAAGQGRGESSKAPQRYPGSTSSPASQPQGGQSGQAEQGDSSAAAKKRKHRAGKKHRRHRRQSFAPTEASDITTERPDPRHLTVDSAARNSFYRIDAGKRSTDSIASEALLDHRDSGPLQARRQSIHQSQYAPPRSSFMGDHESPVRSMTNSTVMPGSSGLSHPIRPYENGEEDYEETSDRTPLIATTKPKQATSGVGYGGLTPSTNRQRSKPRSVSSNASRKSRPLLEHAQTGMSSSNLFDVNNPPSVPGSPVLGAGIGYDDAMLTGDVITSHSPQNTRNARSATSRDALIDINDGAPFMDSTPPSPDRFGRERRHTIAHPAEEDVCFPAEGMSAIGEEDYMQMQQQNGQEYQHRRRRRRQWPDLETLDHWSREEKEERTMEGIRIRKVSEPLMVGGRLRPTKNAAWHRQDDDAPYRFTYFNEEFQNTIHSQTIGELLQPGQTFRDLFIPDPPLLSDESSDEEDEDDLASRVAGSVAGTTTRQSYRPGDTGSKIPSGEQTGRNTPVPSSAQDHPYQKTSKEPRYGSRPVFWLDVMSPTDAEMKVISKAFGIHPLTSEDIMMQEAREKVELFRHYYFVNYRTFEQDPNSEDYLDPVNMFVVVFREGVISFHFSMTPHPANVRRRIRQLSDYLILSSDWISYAIIDDITDVYAPLIQRIEEEVDEIDDEILRLHMTDSEPEKKAGKNKNDEKMSESGESIKENVHGDMLLRVGECRKKVMGLYRLLGNKADVIKGFAKRCNEQWDVAPRSEIGLYLGDIQDHIVTMTGNLTHYESLLSRAHGNYLAQINIRMNERQEQTADVLGKLTVLGTIVLPMNIITGMWGMNVLVPGQDVDSLWWFWGITAGLLAFGLSSFFIAKKVYGIV